MSTVNLIREPDKIVAKALAYEYVILQMSKWYFLDKKYDTIEMFNKENDINFTKLLLYPFFTCIANGSFNTLYDFFGPFYALDEGPTSSLALTLVLENNMRHFDFDAENGYNLKLKDGYLIEEAFNTIEKEILETTINLNDNSSTQFKDISFEDNGKTIAKAIISSIDAINKQTEGKFIQYNNYQIITLARQHRSWSTIYNYYSLKSDSKLSDLEIPKEEAAKDRKVYKSFEELESIQV
jgi:hypothetical protein